FTRSHPHFQRLLGNGLVREHPNPDLATPLDSTRHGTTCRFNLARSNTPTLDCFQSVLTEAHLTATMSQAAVATFHDLAEFSPFWLQHWSAPYFAVFLLREAFLSARTCSMPPRISPLKIHTFTP